MTLFLSDPLTKEWTPTLASIRNVPTRQYGELSQQQFNLPWPMAPRDVLLACDRRANAKASQFTSDCHSVIHDAAPSPAGVVRLELSRTAWKIEALSGERTKLTLSLQVPAKATAGVPAFVVRYCQKSSLKDSVSQLLAAVDRLRLPPHADFVSWRRSRADAATAGCGGGGVLGGNNEPSTPALLLLFICHCVAFACLARRWHTRQSESSTATDAVDDESVAIVTSAAKSERERPGSVWRQRLLRLHGGMMI